MTDGVLIRDLARLVMEVLEEVRENWNNQVGLLSIVLLGQTLLEYAAALGSAATCGKGPL